MGHSYAAAIRMRADVGSENIDLRGGFREQFLNNATWPIVGHIAGLSAVPSEHFAGKHSRRREVVSCDFPRLKRIDFCALSVPAAPLLDTLSALTRLLSGNGEVEQRCHDFLNSSLHEVPTFCGRVRRDQHIFSESVLFCAMQRRLHWLFSMFASL